MSHAQIPIVLTGAMLPASRPGSDAAANLSAAIRVAAEASAAGLGPLVVMGNEIHSARWAMKVHSTNFAAFASPGFGPIGVVSEGNVRLWGATRPTPLGRPSQIQHRVELLYMASGDDGRLAKAAGEFSDGLVIAGMGGGHVPPRAADVLGELARQIPIVLASRCIAGPVLTSTYSGAGSESDLIAKGLLPVGQLHPVKARLRLLVGLALGLRPEEIFPV
jgi:L-asparaginase